MNDDLTCTTYGGRVALDMTLADFNLLLMALGYACGAAMKDGKPEEAEWFTGLVKKLWGIQ